MIRAQQKKCNEVESFNISERSKYANIKVHKIQLENLLFVCAKTCEVQKTLKMKTILVLPNPKKILLL